MRHEYRYPGGTTYQPDYWHWPYDTTTPNQPYFQQWHTLWYSCPYCNGTIKAGSVYCPHCGAKLIPEETETDKLDAILRKLDELIEIVKSK